MPTAKISIDEVYKNVSDAGLETNSSEIIDGIFDKRNENGRIFNVFKKRPGLLSFVDLTGDSMIRGLFWWENQDVILSILDNKTIYKVDEDGTKTDISGSGYSGKTRPIFTTDGLNAVYIASGGRLIKCETPGHTFSPITSTNSPSLATHVGFLNQYILANETNTNTFYWSNAGDSSTWGALDFASAESHSDNLIALHVVNERIYLFGTETIEQWYNDASSLGPFSRIPGGTISRGCIAPYSIQKINETLMWLDDRKKVVILNGSTIQIVSNPFDKFIQSLQYIEDAFAYIIEISGQIFYILNFPSENVTLCYSLTFNYWVKWSYFNTVTTNHDRFIGESYVYAKTWGKHIIGDKKTSDLYYFSEDYYDDNGDILRTYIKTGNITHGILKKKLNRELRIRAERGAGLSDLSKTPYLMMGWSNDGKQNRGEDWLSWGQIGDRDYVARKRNMGTYRARNLELALSDAISLTIVEMEEDFDILER